MRGAANASEALAVAVTDELARAGLRHAVLSPGSRSAPLAMAMHRDERIAVHVVVDERSAAFVALGIAKSSGRPAAVLSTSGTAAANFFPAVVEARLARAPIVVLTADRPPELRATGAGQTIDQLKLYGDYPLWFCEVGVPEPRPDSVAYWRSTGARAYVTALGPPAGPVHLNLAFRDPLVPIPDDAGWDLPLDGRPGGRPWTETARSPGAAAEADIAGLGEEIAACERGVVVAGGPLADPAPVAAFAAAAGWPLLADPLSGARVGDNAVSCYEALLRGASFAGSHRPDAVVRVGSVGSSKPLAALAAEAPVHVLIDADGEWLDPERSVTRIIAADPGLVLTETAKMLGRRRPSTWLRSWQQAERAARTVIDGLLDAMVEPSEPRTARDLAACLPQGTTLVVASSMPVRDLDWFMAPRPGLRVVANRGANGIDGFVSTAVGVALTGAGAGGGHAVALTGDLSLLHDRNGLSAARSVGADLVIVVVNNDGGGIFSFLPQADFPDGFEALFGTPHGCDFAALAAADECGYRLVERAPDLPTAVGEAGTAGGVQLIEVRTDRAANVELHRRLWEAAAHAVS